VSRKGVREVRSCLASQLNRVAKLDIRPRHVERRTRAQRDRHLPFFLWYFDRLQLAYADSAMQLQRPVLDRVDDTLHVLLSRNSRMSAPLLLRCTSRPNQDFRGFAGRIASGALAAGMLHFALRRSQNVQWQFLDVNKPARARLTGQRPCVVWFTGLSGAGKSTIANLVERKLHAAGHLTYLLDGDNVRHGLNKDLGFTEQDRVENIRRVAEARLMVDAGVIVLVSFISPYRAERRTARSLVGANEFFEVFVDTPLAEAERRDIKGPYGKARRGELKNFTGIDSL
jgi:bifunctional enzyme CysN/CysC